MVLMMMIAVASEAGLTPSDDALWLPYPKVPLAQDCDYGGREGGESNIKRIMKS